MIAFSHELNSRELFFLLFSSILVYGEMKIRKKRVSRFLKHRAELKYLQKYGINRIEKRRDDRETMENCRFHKKNVLYDACLLPLCHCLMISFVAFFVCNEICWRKYFSDFLQMNEDPFFFIALFLALMIVFYFFSFRNWIHNLSIQHTLAVTAKSEIIFHIHSLFYVIFFFFSSFSESVSEFFYVFLFTALLLKNKTSWKLKMNARIFFFWDFSNLVFVKMPKNRSFHVCFR